MRRGLVAVLLVVGCPAPPPPDPPESVGPAPAVVAVPRDGCPEGMVAVDGGSFTMRNPVWGPPTEEDVSSLCVDVIEVTVAAYTECVRAGRCTPARTTDWLGFGKSEPEPSPFCNWGRDGRGDHPVNCVDYEQAEAFCRWRGARLPTPAEWLWVARGGEHGTRYPWGPGEASGRHMCWSRPRPRDQTPADGTCKVKSFPNGASPHGIHDLGGNVWEWTTAPGTTSKQNLETIGGGGYNMRRAALVYETQFGHPLAHHPYLGMRCFMGRHPRVPTAAPIQSAATG